MEAEADTQPDYFTMIWIGLIAAVIFLVLGVLIDVPIVQAVMWFLAGSAGVVYATGIAHWVTKALRKPVTDKSSDSAN